MQRVLVTLLTITGAFAQQTTDLSKEWPTYGHDPGAMRFSPLTQLTPANVAQLKVAWVYHMRPPVVAGAPAPPPVAAPPAGVEGDAPAPAGGGRGGGGRGRFGNGMRPSEATPLVID